MILAEPEWQARAAAHVARVRRWTGPYQERRSRGRKHPVHDFLFQYYPHRPAHLERWSPGPGVVLAGPAVRTFLERPGFHETGEGVELEPFPTKRFATVRALLVLLEATASRAPRLNCFGLHEWAMVYRQPPAQVRHNQLPLRLGPGGTDTVVESLELRCGHYDAFRFFTPPARPRNALEPSRDQQADLEQPGCLHANMDLYRAAFKLDPFVPSELVGDCFELAVEIRELDMRAGPYDLSELGYTPVRIETARGRAEYARAQAEFAARAEPLRDRLIEQCRALLTQGQ